MTRRLIPRAIWLCPFLMACGGVASDGKSERDEPQMNMWSPPTEGEGEPEGSSAGGHADGAGGTMPSTGGVLTGAGGLPLGGAGGGSGAGVGGTPMGAGGEVDGSGGLNACEDLREEFQAIYDMYVDEAQTCTSDGECTYVSYGHNCGHICPQSIVASKAAVIGTPLYEYGETHCGDCWMDYPIGCPSGMPPESVCDNGRCRFVTPYENAGKLSENP